MAFSQQLGDVELSALESGGDHRYVVLTEVEQRLSEEAVLLRSLQQLQLEQAAQAERVAEQLRLAGRRHQKGLDKMRQLDGAVDDLIAGICEVLGQSPVSTTNRSELGPATRFRIWLCLCGRST